MEIVELFTLYHMLYAVVLIKRISRLKYEIYREPPLAHIAVKSLKENMQKLPKVTETPNENHEFSSTTGVYIIHF